MDIKLKLEIHFHQQDEASVFLESNVPSEQEKYAHILLFCNYACRNLYNLGEKGNSLASVLSEVGGKEFLKEIINLDNPDAPNLISYKGSPGRKRFIAKLSFSGKRIANFQLKTKGFWFFGKGMGYYSPNSVMLLLQYLVEKYINDETFLEQLSEAARACAGAYASGKLSPRTEGEITTIIADGVSNKI